MISNLRSLLSLTCVSLMAANSAVSETVYLPDFTARHVPNSEYMFDPFIASLSEPVGGDNFKINVAFTPDPNMTPSQQARLERAYEIAVKFFERSITGYIVPPPIPDPNDPDFPFSPGITAIDITAQTVPIDGPGGILGQAGPTNGVIFGGLGPADSRLTYSTDGIMQFDTADILVLMKAGALIDVVVHEMFHVLGFGSLWSQSFFNGGFFVYDPTVSPGQYVGLNALIRFRAEFDPPALSIPVETGTGNVGTDHSHWAEVSEVWGGGVNEIMTGFLSDPTFVSETSLHAFRDLGYTTLDTLPFQPTAVPAPPAIVALGGALLLLGAARRSRGRRTVT